MVSSDSSPDSAPPAGKKSWLSAWSVEIFAGAVTLASGVVTAWKTVDKNFHKNLDKNSETVAAIRADRDAEYLQFYKECEGSRDTKKLHEGIRKIYGDYRSKLKGYLGDIGVKNVFDKYGTLKGHEKLEVWLAASGVTVALGAIIGIAGSRRAVEQQRVGQEQDGQSAQR